MQPPAARTPRSGRSTFERCANGKRSAASGAGLVPEEQNSSSGRVFAFKAMAIGLLPHRLRTHRRARFQGRRRQRRRRSLRSRGSRTRRPRSRRPKKPTRGQSSGAMRPAARKSTSNMPLIWACEISSPPRPPTKFTTGTALPACCSAEHTLVMTVPSAPNADVLLQHADGCRVRQGCSDLLCGERAHVADAHQARASRPAHAAAPRRSRARPAMEPSVISTMSASSQSTARSGRVAPAEHLGEARCFRALDGVGGRQHALDGRRA